MLQFVLEISSNSADRTAHIAALRNG